MPRNIHDSFAKDWMREFLTDFGTVETEYEISSEVRHVDVYFEPNPDLLPAPMGLFGQMIRHPCLIEPFRKELLALPAAHPYRATTLRHIAVLQRNLRARQNITRDLQEVIMTLSITYEQIEAEIIEKGLHQGREEGREEGRGETQQMIARKMLQEGMSPETVSRLTGLTIDQLPQL
jgi:hypothetical protein